MSREDIDYESQGGSSRRGGYYDSTRERGSWRGYRGHSSEYSRGYSDGPIRHSAPYADSECRNYDDYYRDRSFRPYYSSEMGYRDDFQTSQRPPRRVRQWDVPSSYAWKYPTSRGGYRGSHYRGDSGRGETYRYSSETDTGHYPPRYVGHRAIVRRDTASMSSNEYEVPADDSPARHQAGEATEEKTRLKRLFNTLEEEKEEESEEEGAASSERPLRVHDWWKDEKTKRLQRELRWSRGKHTMDPKSRPAFPLIASREIISQEEGSRETSGSFGTGQDEMYDDAAGKADSSMNSVPYNSERIVTEVKSDDSPALSVKEIVLKSVQPNHTIVESRSADDSSSMDVEERVSAPSVISSTESRPECLETASTFIIPSVSESGIHRQTTSDLNPEVLVPDFTNSILGSWEDLAAATWDEKHIRVPAEPSNPPIPLPLVPFPEGSGLNSIRSTTASPTDLPVPEPLPTSQDFPVPSSDLNSRSRKLLQVASPPFDVQEFGTKIPKKPVDRDTPPRVAPPRVSPALPPPPPPFPVNPPDISEVVVNQPTVVISRRAGGKFVIRESDDEMEVDTVPAIAPLVPVSKIEDITAPGPAKIDAVEPEIIKTAPEPPAVAEDTAQAASHPDDVEAAYIAAQIKETEAEMAKLELERNKMKAKWESLRRIASLQGISPEKPPEIPQEVGSPRIDAMSRSATSSAVGSHASRPTDLKRKASQEEPFEASDWAPKRRFDARKRRKEQSAYEEMLLPGFDSSDEDTYREDQLLEKTKEEFKGSRKIEKKSLRKSGDEGAKVKGEEKPAGRISASVRDREKVKAAEEKEEKDEKSVDREKEKPSDAISARSGKSDVKTRQEFLQGKCRGFSNMLVSLINHFYDTTTARIADNVSIADSLLRFASSAVVFESPNQLLRFIVDIVNELQETSLQEPASLNPIEMEVFKSEVVHFTSSFKIDLLRKRINSDPWNEYPASVMPSDVAVIQGDPDMKEALVELNAESEERQKVVLEELWKARKSMFDVSRIEDRSADYSNMSKLWRIPNLYEIERIASANMLKRWNGIADFLSDLVVAKKDVTVEYCENGHVRYFSVACDPSPGNRGRWVTDQRKFRHVFENEVAIEKQHLAVWDLTGVHWPVTTPEHLPIGAPTDSTSSATASVESLPEKSSGSKSVPGTMSDKTSFRSKSSQATRTVVSGVSTERSGSLRLKAHKLVGAAASRLLLLGRFEKIIMGESMSGATGVSTSLLKHFGLKRNMAKQLRAAVRRGYLADVNFGISESELNPDETYNLCGVWRTSGSPPAGKWTTLMLSIEEGVVEGRQLGKKSPLSQDVIKSWLEMEAATGRPDIHFQNDEGNPASQIWRPQFTIPIENKMAQELVRGLKNDSTVIFQKFTLSRPPQNSLDMDVEEPSVSEPAAQSAVQLQVVPLTGNTDTGVMSITMRPQRYSSVFVFRHESLVEALKSIRPVQDRSRRSRSSESLPNGKTSPPDETTLPQIAAAGSVDETSQGPIDLLVSTIKENEPHKVASTVSALLTLRSNKVKALTRARTACRDLYVSWKKNVAHREKKFIDDGDPLQCGKLIYDTLASRAPDINPLPEGFLDGVLKVYSLSYPTFEPFMGRDQLKQLDYFTSSAVSSGRLYDSQLLESFSHIYSGLPELSSRKMKFKSPKIRIRKDHTARPFRHCFVLPCTTVVPNNKVLQLQNISHSLLPLSRSDIYFIGAQRRILAAADLKTRSTPSTPSSSPRREDTSVWGRSSRRSGGIQLDDESSTKLEPSPEGPSLASPTTKAQPKGKMGNWLRGEYSNVLGPSPQWATSALDSLGVYADYFFLQQQTAVQVKDENRLISTPENVRPVVPDCDRIWSINEMAIYIDKYFIIGKNYKRLAQLLGSGKTSNDCVEFKYKFKFFLKLTSKPALPQATRQDFAERQPQEKSQSNSTDLWADDFSWSNLFREVKGPFRKLLAVQVLNDAIFKPLNRHTTSKDGISCVHEFVLTQLYLAKIEQKRIERENLVPLPASPDPRILQGTWKAPASPDRTVSYREMHAGYMYSVSVNDDPSPQSTTKIASIIALGCRPVYLDLNTMEEKSISDFMPIIVAQSPAGSASNVANKSIQDALECCELVGALKDLGQTKAGFFFDEDGHKHHATRKRGMVTGDHSTTTSSTSFSVDNLDSVSITPPTFLAKPVRVSGVGPYWASLANQQLVDSNIMVQFLNEVLGIVPGTMKEKQYMACKVLSDVLSCDGALKIIQARVTAAGTAGRLTRESAAAANTSNSSARLMQTFKELAGVILGQGIFAPEEFSGRRGSGVSSSRI